ncbi:MGMT family protein [Kaistella jeonii]|uniref:Cysteine methyltransferase n=1 Tax=Kaistella jeonii TaxID=266749 RepID=A0A0C1F0F3_9FLAO|nr:MGMT family protein [Kaistella jeonii]KIA85448.1 cysteine methyltransferase [Kaistella jeonii]SFC42650.1 methylated-DNA-protein-cysteine methyltransferase related protein [Kaistella jeonii]VEI96805.1 Predicted methylated DNA-protein cysteine methyltransferase [Kaistella jeonii]
MNELFKKQVFEIIMMIPEGRVTNYGAIAKAVGFPNHSRQVGNVLKNYDEDFPAYRVCNSSGRITASCQRDFVGKLKLEGVEVKDGKIQNFKKIFWNPLEEL